MKERVPANRETRKPARSYPASAYLHDELLARGMTVDELADVAMIPRIILDEILNYDVQITEAISKRLGFAFEMSHDFWFRIDQGHREWVRRQRGGPV